MGARHTSMIIVIRGLSTAFQWLARQGSAYYHGFWYSLLSGKILIHCLIASQPVWKLNELQPL
jgi:hypothetical protein